MNNRECPAHMRATSLASHCFLATNDEDRIVHLHGKTEEQPMH